MRTGLFFIVLLSIGVIFLAFNDENKALKDEDLNFKLTEEQERWAKEYIVLYWESYYKAFFPLSDTKVSPRTYAYDICQYVIFLAILCFLIERSWVGERPYVLGYTLIVALDLVDYLLTHNDPYLFIVYNGMKLPISFNIVSIAIYSLFCTYITLGNELRRS